MDNWTIFLRIPLLILTPIVIYTSGRGSVFTKVLGAIGGVWVVVMLFFSEPMFGVEMGPAWFLICSPGFAIFIYLKYKEQQSKRSHNE